MPRPYVGASEGIGADTIFYHFDKPQAHEGKPFKAARRLGRLVGVSEKTSYASSALAASHWGELVGELRKRGMPIECHSIRPFETTLLSATVNRTNVGSEILLIPEHTLHDVVGAYHFPATIFASVRYREKMRDPETMKEYPIPTTVACPER